MKELLQQGECGCEWEALDGYYRTAALLLSGPAELTFEGKGQQLWGHYEFPGSPPLPYVAFGLDHSLPPAGLVGIHVRGRIIKTQYFVPLSRGQIGKWHWVMRKEGKDPK